MRRAALILTIAIATIFIILAIWTSARSDKDESLPTPQDLSETAHKERIAQPLKKPTRVPDTSPPSPTHSVTVEEPSDAPELSPSTSKTLLQERSRQPEESRRRSEHDENFADRRAPDEDPPAAPLGPATWMAQPTEIDLDELEGDLLEGEMRQEFELAMREDRHRALHLADQVPRSCPHVLARDARVAIEFTLHTDAGRGFIRSPRQLHSINIDDPTFIECILDNLSDLEFNAAGDGADLQVTWIFPR